MTKALMNLADFILLNKTEKTSRDFCFSHFTGATVLLNTRINRSHRDTKIDLCVA